MGRVLVGEAGMSLHMPSRELQKHKWKCVPTLWTWAGKTSITLPFCHHMQSSGQVETHEELP